MDLRYDVITTPFAGGLIKQEVFSISDDVRESLVRSIIDTREQHLRQALIALGWTPPKSEEENSGLDTHERLSGL